MNRSFAAAGSAAREGLVAAYEELRRRALHEANPQGLGMALLLEQGVTAWIEAGSWSAPALSHHPPPQPGDPAPVPRNFRGEIVVLLAAMVLGQSARVRA